MLDTGDLHNFGRQVSRDDVTKQFYKPRCIFWEQFYLSQKSPIYQFFLHKISSTDFNFFKEHFLLSISGNNLALDGYSQELTNQPLTKDISFFNVGQLIAYCSIFGLMDLHNGNIIFNGKNIIPIDIEVINAIIRVPSETLLFPINSEERPYSLYHSLLPFLNAESATKVVEGMKHFLKLISQYGDELKNELSHIDLTTYPIRVILRHTLDYRKEFIDDLILEEELQLKRGDIPYFFKYLHDNRLYYYDKNLNPLVCSALNERALKKMNLIGNSFETLLSTKRLEMLLPNMILQFLRYVQQDLNLSLIQGLEFKYEEKNNEIFLELDSKIYKTTTLKN